MKRQLVLFGLWIGLAASPAAAQSVDAFSLNWFNGEQDGAVYNSADHPQAVFVLEVFQNNCGACNRNAPNVDGLAEAYEDNELVQVLDIGIGQTPRELASWINRHQPNHPVLQGRRVLMEQIGIRATPTTVVLDCNLNEVYRTVGVWSATVAQEIISSIDGALEADACAVTEEDIEE